MQDKITTNNGNVICSECKNEFKIDSNLQMGDVVECSFCGIEYEIEEKTGDATYSLHVIEEEK